MKRKFKLIVPSFVALIFCFLLIAGSTFALFTSKADASISVSTGKVKIEAQLGDMKRYSAIPDDNIAQNDPLYAGYATAHEVSSHYAYQLQGSGNGSFLTNGQATLSEENKLLTLDRIAPGDRVTLKLVIENKSDVNIKYRIRVNALELLDADQSYKLFKQLTILLDNDDSIDNDDLDDLNGVNKVGLWKTIGAGGEINDLMIDISLPVDSSDDYQELKTKIQFTVEAVQGNANTNTLLEQINDYLASRPTKNNTMHDALQDVIDFGTPNSKTYNLDTIRPYLWNSETDQFYTEDSIEGFIGQYFKVYDSMPNEQTYNIYASNAWPTTSVEGLKVGFDAGDANITSIKYNRSTEAKGKEVIIRTNNLTTTLEINAPLDVVHHYGDAGILQIIAIGGQSYHEFGKVAFVEIAKGRVALEEGSKVSQVHISTSEVYNEQTEKNEIKFDEIIVSIHEKVDKPTFSRDDVEIASTGTLVVALQAGTEEVTEDTELDYVWLTKQGIYEQIKVSDNSESAGNVWVDQLTGSTTEEQAKVAKTQEAANEIANNIGRDDNNNIKVEVTVEAGTSNETTYVVQLNEDRDLVVVDKEDTTKEEIATINESGSVTVNNNTFTVELANNEENTTELVVTNVSNPEEVVKATAIEQSGLSEQDKEEQKEAVVEEVIDDDVASDEDNVVRIKTVGYTSIAAAIDAAKDNDTIILVRNVTESISINKNITLDLAGYTLTAESNKAAITAYSLDNLTVKNGNINGQIRIGEHKSVNVKWKHLNYVDNYEAVPGYHPLAPAKNVVLQNLNVNSGNQPSLYFTNIEDDLVRGAPSNYCDNDLYGHYIYKTGYTTPEQSVKNKKDEVFTVCTDKDFVTVIGGTYIGSSFVGNMETYKEKGQGELIEGVLKVCKGTTINNDRAGRFVENGKVLVGITNSTFVVNDLIPAEYTARVNDVYYTYAGGANDAIKFANIGEEVYINENAEYGKVISQGEEFTVISLSENVSWTGARVSESTYQIVETPDGLNPLKIVYTVGYAAVARLYHFGNTRRIPNKDDVFETYGSLKAAVDAAVTGDYVMLMQDTIISEEDDSLGSSYVKFGINISNNKRIALDLNGHTYIYTGSGAAIISTAKSGSSNGQYTIRDTSTEKTGTVYATKGYAFAKYNKETKEGQHGEDTFIYGGNFISGTTYALYISNASHFYIEGGRFISLNNKSPIYGTTHIESISDDVIRLQTTVGSEQFLIINSDESLEVADLTKLGENEYILTAPAGKKVLLPAITKIGYEFSWETADSHTTKSGLVLNSSDTLYQINCIELTEFSISVSESNATVTVLVNGSEWDRISSVTYGDTINVSVDYTYTGDNATTSCTIKDQNNVSYQLNTDFSMPRANLTINASSSEKNCLTEGTLVKLVDGSLTAVENIKAGDKLLAFDHETGELVESKVMFNDMDEKAIYDVLSLNFENGQTVNVVDEHGFFDLDLMEYVYITNNNYMNYLGHKFALIEGYTTLLSGEIHEEEVALYSPVTARTLNLYVEDLLTMPGGVEGIFNIFAYDNDLKYNQELKEQDILEYGLLGYEYFEDLIPYEVYVAFNGEYLGVAMGKGILTEENLNYYIARYSQFWN